MQGRLGIRGVHGNRGAIGPWLIPGLLLAFWGCSATPAPDATPPAPVVDLAVVSTGDTSAVLAWTAPEGRAAAYDFRYVAGELPRFWRDAVTFPTPRPGLSGAPETLRVTGLRTAVDYGMALTSSDAAGNVSELSNIVIAATGDRTPPEAVEDLTLAGLDETSARLAWTAPADDRRVVAYDVRYTTAELPDGWQAAIRVPGPPPGDPGAPESLRVTGLSDRSFYHMAVRSVDAAGNASALSNIVRIAGGDRTPPAAVKDLAVAGLDATSAVLAWTTPRDDRRVAAYDVRYTTADLPDGWSTAIRVPGPPPRDPGTPCGSGSWDVPPREADQVSIGTAWYLGS